jgi:hypothetical protein
VIPIGVLHLILCQLYENNVRSSGGGSIRAYESVRGQNEM